MIPVLFNVFLAIVASCSDYYHWPEKLAKMNPTCVNYTTKTDPMHGTPYHKPGSCEK